MIGAEPAGSSLARICAVPCALCARCDSRSQRTRRLTPPERLALPMKLKRAREIIERFSGRRILVLGDCMLDHWLWGSVSRISPEAPVPVVDIERSTYTPGGAANVVHNLCSLHARTSIVGLVGDDEAGRRLRSMLSDQGADVSAHVADPERPTTTKTRIIAHSQQVVRADSERRGPLTEEQVTRMLEAVGDDLGGCQALLVSDYNKGVVGGRLLSTLMERARNHDVPVIVGPKPENIRSFPQATLLALNDKEASGAAGRPARLAEEAEAAGKHLLSTLGCRALVITRGAQGMSLVARGRRAHHVPALARQVYDVSGAGDTVITVLTLAVAAGATLTEATTLANLAAAVVVQKIGTATVSGDEIVQAFRENTP